MTNQNVPDNIINMNRLKKLQYQMCNFAKYFDIFTILLKSNIHSMYNVFEFFTR